MGADIGASGSTPATPRHAARTSRRRTSTTPAAHRGRSVAVVNPHKESCMKAFVIFTVAIAALTLITGALGILSSQNVLASGISGVSQLSQIGAVNSYLMVGGGFVLFILGIVTLTCKRNGAAEQK